MTTSLNSKASVILIILFFLCPVTSFAKEARISDLVISNTRDNLILFLKAQGAFKEKTEKAVLTGVPVTISFFITLSITRNMWFDKNIADIKVTHTIKYSALKKEYIIYRSWDTNNPAITQSFLEARKLMTEINSLEVVSLDRLKKGNQYKISAKAKLNKQTLPYYLHHILFFLSLWNFETNWHTIHFVY